MVLICGKIAVPTPGTPVQLTQSAEYLAALQSAFGTSVFQTAQAVLFQAWGANTGTVYVGKSTLNRSTGAGVAAALSSTSPNFGAANQMAPAGVDLSAFFLDADDANDGALVTILMS